MAGEKAWSDRYGDDHALSGLWKRERIVFPGKGADGPRDRYFAVGGQQVAKLPEDVQALHVLENLGGEGGSIV